MDGRRIVGLGGERLLPWLCFRSNAPLRLERLREGWEEKDF